MKFGNNSAIIGDNIVKFRDIITNSHDNIMKFRYNIVNIHDNIAIIRNKYGEYSQ